MPELQELYNEISHLRDRAGSKLEKYNHLDPNSNIKYYWLGKLAAFDLVFKYIKAAIDKHISHYM